MSDSDEEVVEKQLKVVFVGESSVGKVLTRFGGEHFQQIVYLKIKVTCSTNNITIYLAQAYRNIKKCIYKFKSSAISKAIKTKQIVL